MSTRYYRKRLWKISWAKVNDRRGKLIRLVKYYEHREAIGLPWKLVRAIVEEYPIRSTP